MCNHAPALDLGDAPRGRLTAGPRRWDPDGVCGGGVGDGQGGRGGGCQARGGGGDCGCDAGSWRSDSGCHARSGQCERVSHAQWWQEQCVSHAEWGRGARVVCAQGGDGERVGHAQWLQDRCVSRAEWGRDARVGDAQGGRGERVGHAQWLQDRCVSRAEWGRDARVGDAQGGRGERVGDAQGGRGERVGDAQGGRGDPALGGSERANSVLLPCSSPVLRTRPTPRRVEGLAAPLRRGGISARCSGSPAAHHCALASTRAGQPACLRCARRLADARVLALDGPWSRAARSTDFGARSRWVPVRGVTGALASRAARSTAFGSGDGWLMGEGWHIKPRHESRRPDRPEELPTDRWVRPW